VCDRDDGRRRRRRRRRMTGRRTGCRIKNKNPTQRCGEKHIVSNVKPSSLLCNPTRLPPSRLTNST